MSKSISGNSHGIKQNSRLLPLGSHPERDSFDDSVNKSRGDSDFIMLDDLDSVKSPSKSSRIVKLPPPKKNHQSSNTQAYVYKGGFKMPKPNSAGEDKLLPDMFSASN